MSRLQQLLEYGQNHWPGRNSCCRRARAKRAAGRASSIYRIDTFRLRDIFPAFFSSCHLGVRKPDARIYEIALDVMQAEPATSLFVDAGPVQRACAHHTGPAG